MKYLCISDTHSYITHAVECIEKIKPDYCIHLGDTADDCEDIESIFPRQKFIFVKGNNDYFLKSALFPDERIFDLEGKKFFICHGHKYNVKYGTSLLKKKGFEIKADIVLYGHTHVQSMENDGNMLILNPGSKNHHAIITIIDGKVSAELF